MGGRNGKPEIEPYTLTGKLLLQGINALRKSDGKAQVAKYPDTPEGMEDFREKSIAYLTSVMHECEDSDDLQNTPYPNIESWCAYLNISRVTLHNYTKRSEEWQEVILQIKTVIVSVKSQLADHGKIPPMTWVFDAANNFNYHNTNEFRLTADESIKTVALTASELPRLVPVGSDALPDLSAKDDKGQ